MKVVIEVPSTGNLLYGTVTHLTDRGLMIVLASHRRKMVEVTRKVKGRIEVVKRYLADWEEVSPERELCAWRGRYSMVKGPEEAKNGSIN